MNLKFGIDVSYCQGIIDWDKVKNSDVEFVIARTGYSFGDHYKDKHFLKNINGAKKAGLEIPGVYHFSYALSEEDARKEANSALSQVKSAGLANDTTIFFDFEYASSDFCKDNGVDPSSEFVQKVTEAFCERVRSLGYVPGIYVNPDYYNRVYEGKLPADIKVWAAKWITWGDDFFDRKPKFNFDVWQYGTTRIPGIVGEVDACVVIEPDPVVDEVKMESKKSNEDIANEVIKGLWGNGAERRRKLEEAGYDYKAVQAIVNTYFE